MEKLELKHLAPYLPYSLKVMDLYDNKERFFVGYSINHTEPVKISVYKNLLSTGRLLSEVKPILRPLSDFNTGIAKDIMKDLNCSYLVVSDIWAFEDGSIKFKDLRFETYNVMCKKHIDFGGLIKEGYAVNVNSIK